MVCVFSTSGQNYNFALLCYLVTNLCGNAVYFVQKKLKLSRRLVSSRLEYSRKRNYDIFSQFLHPRAGKYGAKKVFFRPFRLSLAPTICP